MRHAVLAILAFSTAAYSLGAQERLNADQWLSRAQQAFESGAWAEAREAAENARSANPRLADAYVLLGLVATQQLRIPDAEQLFRKAASLEPANFRTLNYLGSSCLQQGRAAEAEKLFNRVLAMDPSNSPAHYNLGVIYLSREQAAQARKHFDAVLQVDTRDIPAGIGSLECDLILKDSEKAQRAIRTLDGILPAASADRLRVGALLGSHEDYEDAASVLEKIPAQAAFAREAGFNLALALYHLKDFDRAVKILNPLSEDAEALNLLGEIEEARQHPAAAGDAYRKAAERAPEQEKLWSGYGLFLVHQQRFSEAEAVFAAGLTHNPRSADLRLGRAVALAASEVYSESVTVLLKLQTENPKVPKTYHLLAQLYETVPELQDRIDGAFRDYIKTKPDDAVAYCDYGMLLFRRADSLQGSDFLAAKMSLEKSLALNPRLAEAYWQLGAIEQAAGRSKESIRLLRKALELKPDLWNARYRLALELHKTGAEAEAKQEMQQFNAHKEADAARARQEMVDALSGPSQTRKK